MNYFNDHKYFVTEIVFRSFSQTHFLFADTHVLPDTKLGCRESNPLYLNLRPTRYFKDVSVGHSRSYHTSCGVNCVNVRLDKFRQNIYIAVGILVRKISLKSIFERTVSTFYDRTFHIGISANLKLNALIM